MSLGIRWITIAKSLSTALRTYLFKGAKILTGLVCTTVYPVALSWTMTEDEDDWVTKIKISNYTTQLYVSYI